jgi:hypothetical protein
MTFLPGSVIEMTVKWSITYPVITKLTAHFAKFRTVGKIFLILDGTKTHLDADAIDAAGDNIILF